MNGQAAAGLLQRGRRPLAPADGRRVWRLPADVDAEALAPAKWLKYDAAVIAQHCLETLRPQFALEVTAGDVIVAGANFGIGSSREQAASVLVHLGIAAVIAPSFGGLFFRNAFNVGLLLLTCRDADALADGERVVFDIESGVVRVVANAAGEPLGARGPLLGCEPLPDFLIERVGAGGLLPQLRRRFAKDGG